MDARKQVHFMPQCAVRYIETNEEEKEEAGGCSSWYQPKEFRVFKQERKTLVRRIRAVGIGNAHNFALQGIEHLLTNESKDRYVSRIYDARFVVIEEQIRAERFGGRASDDDIARRYRVFSHSSHSDAHARAVRTAHELGGRSYEKSNVEMKSIDLSEESESEPMLISKSFDKWGSDLITAEQIQAPTPIRQSC